MKHLALAVFAGALACCAVTVSSEAAPVSGVANLATSSPASSLVDHVRCGCGCGCHYYRPLFRRGCHHRWWW
jgi:hypothetical protein